MDHQGGKEELGKVAPASRDDEGRLDKEGPNGGYVHIHVQFYDKVGLKAPLTCLMMAQ